MSLKEIDNLLSDTPVCDWGKIRCDKGDRENEQRNSLIQKWNICRYLVKLLNIVIKHYKLLGNHHLFIDTIRVNDGYIS